MGCGPFAPTASVGKAPPEISHNENAFSGLVQHFEGVYNGSSPALAHWNAHPSENVGNACDAVEPSWKKLNNLLRSHCPVQKVITKPNHRQHNQKIRQDMYVSTLRDIECEVVVTEKRWKLRLRQLQKKRNKTGQSKTDQIKEVEQLCNNTAYCRLVESIYRALGAVASWYYAWKITVLNNTLFES